MLLSVHLFRCILRSYVFLSRTREWKFNEFAFPEHCLDSIVYRQ